MIPRAVIEEIIRRNDIEQTIGTYVQLKSAGSNMVGLCPFHSEKSPSFTVFRGTDSFYCFGCGAGGDVITFIMKAENLEYRAALELLAARAGIPIPDDDTQIQTGPGRERIRQMNRVAATFFHNCLVSEPCGAEAREYLKKRGLTDKWIRRFYLGYSPDDFGMLRRYMYSQGFNDEELLTGFLCGKSTKNGKAYDYFRNRVMFPIVDVTRNVVAFGGRVMDDSKPKYLNTSDTPAFKKSRTLFALNYAKDFCSEQLILCEGYMDVIALHMGGFQNAVATLGTAITDDHARLIAKYTKKVIVSYDSDEAGVNAANKAMRVLGRVGVDVRILTIDGAKDPDEYLRKFGPDKFKLMLEDSRTGFEFKLKAVSQKYDLNIPEQKLSAASDAVAIIADYYSAVEREVYIARVAEAFGISTEAIRGDVDRLRTRKIREIKNEQSRGAYSTLSELGDVIIPDASQNPRAASAQETIIGLLLIYEDQREDVACGRVALSADDFISTFWQRAFNAIMRLHSEPGGYIFSLLGGEFTADEMGRLQKAEMKRRSLTENGSAVMREAAEILRAEKNKSNGEQVSLEDEIAARRRRLEEERRKRKGS